MTEEDEKIQDLGTSPNSPEWMPPIGAMGGPPAHELYRDLVQHADLRLLRGPNAEPWLILLDGEHHRAFPVPSVELMAALDRFRMRRNLRPVPEKDVEDFGRTVQARVSDPDAELPVWEPRTAPGTIVPPTAVPRPPAVRLPQMIPPTATAIAPAEGPVGASPWDEAVEPGPPMAVLPPVRPTTVSGGILPPRRSNNDSLPRYVKVLHEMVRNGDWLGTLDDLSNEIGEDSFTVFASLIRHRTDLAAEGIVVAPVEVEDGWRWLAVDRGRIHDGKPE
jgi:hypothetical protein